MKEWLTVAEAALLVGRDKRQIYRWIEAGRLATRLNERGATEVLSKSVLRIEPEVKRGRPRGTPSRNTRRGVP